MPGGSIGITNYVEKAERGFIRSWYPTGLEVLPKKAIGLP